jgi:predicted RNase H-like nuclease
VRSVREEVLAAGVDGCRGGWIAAGRLPYGEITIRFFASFAELVAEWPVAAIAIDIPIGLSPCYPRSCDRLVRQRLGPRRSSVFPPPLRPALHARSYAEACSITLATSGKSVGAQAWNIYGKIAEVDSAISPALQQRVLESHPELCFTMMNEGRPAAFSKKSVAGRAQRLELLERRLPGSMSAAALRRPSGCANDDLLDALAVLWTAERFLRGEARALPEQAELDDRGLRMEIWY